MITFIDLTLDEAYSTPWSASITDADSRIISSSSPAGAMALGYEGSSDLSGDPPAGGFGILLRSRAVGVGTGTVDLSMIPSTAIITQLRVKARRSGAAHSTWLWTYVSGPAPPQGAYILGCQSDARVKVVAAAADINVNQLDTDTNSGSFFPGGTLFTESHTDVASAESEKITALALSKAAFITANHDDLAAVIGDSVNQDADNFIGASGGAPFSRLLRVEQSIDGNLSFAFLEYELTWTPAAPFSLSPNHGPDIGGTTVSIFGAGFSGTTGVMFGALAADSFTVINDGLIEAVTPPQIPSVVMVTVLAGAASTDIALYTYEPAVDYWGDGPPDSEKRGRIMIVSPNVGTNYSRGKTVTMMVGTPLTRYPATNVVDDSAESALRISEKQIEFYIDLGVERTPDAVAVLNHNLDRHLLVQVQTGASVPGMTPVANFSAGFVNGWLDVRGLANRTGRYWKIRITTDNSVPITIGEVVIGSAYVMDGVVDPNWKRKTKHFVAREFTEEMLPYKMHSGARIRQVEIGFVLDPVNRAIIETVFDDAGTTGNRVLVIPDTGKNDPYFIDWPSRRALSFPQSLREAKIVLLLTEQSGGVV